MNQSFVPSESNANSIETWQYTGGNVPLRCIKKSKKNEERIFFLGKCAVNCYIQWYSGLSCPDWNIPIERQYEVARERVFRYNMIMLIEKLSDPKYVQEIEKFFGVIGVVNKKKPWCEKESHNANEKNPLVVPGQIRERLETLNQLDIKLYHDLTSCLRDGSIQYNSSWAVQGPFH